MRFEANLNVDVEGVSKCGRCMFAFPVSQVFMDRELEPADR